MRTEAICLMVFLVVATAVFAETNKLERPVVYLVRSLRVARESAAKAERAEKSGEESQARQHRLDAVAAYQRVTLLANYRDPAERRCIQEGMLGSIPLLIKLERLEEARDMCDWFLQRFPGERRSDLEPHRQEIRLRMTPPDQLPKGTGEAG